MCFVFVFVFNKLICPFSMLTENQPEQSLHPLPVLLTRVNSVIKLSSSDLHLLSYTICFHTPSTKTLNHDSTFIHLMLAPLARELYICSSLLLSVLLLQCLFPWPGVEISEPVPKMVEKRRKRREKPPATDGNSWQWWAWRGCRKGKQIAQLGCLGTDSNLSFVWTEYFLIMLSLLVPLVLK